MKFSQAQAGRVFVLRLEDGEIIHETIEAFAREQGITAAGMIVLGGADKDSRLVVAPREGRAVPLEPMTHVLDDVHEIAGTGTIFPDSQGNPVLHMHITGGRADRAVTGCVRTGVKVWHVLEVIVWELAECNSRRLLEADSGFELLNP